MAHLTGKEQGQIQAYSTRVETAEHVCGSGVGGGGRVNLIKLPYLLTLCFQTGRPD